MNQRKFKSKQSRSWWRGRLAIGLALALTVLFSGTALAAEVLRGDPYILPRGEVVNDDLYVTGSEVIIDGTVEGDLVVAGGYVEINGVVMGDLLAAGGAVVIAGTIQDDVRAAGGAVILSGRVADDFMAAAGGGWPGMMTMPISRMDGTVRNVPQGLQVSAGATIGGDAYIAGGQGLMAGSVGRDLVAGMGTLTLSGRVAGDANVGVQNLTVADSAHIQGELRYSSGNDAAIPPGVAASVLERPREEVAPTTPARQPIRGFFMWLLRTGLILAGYLLAGWLLWTFAPRRITVPTTVIEKRPMEAAITGLIGLVALVPVAAALTFLAVLFWNWFPGGLFVATFIFGSVAVVWLLSPVFVGLWVGSRLRLIAGVPDEELPRLLLGIAAIVLVARLLSVVPCVGDVAFQVIYLVALTLTVGSWFLARRRPPQEAALMPAVA